MQPDTRRDHFFTGADFLELRFVALFLRAVLAFFFFLAIAADIYNLYANDASLIPAGNRQ